VLVTKFTQGAWITALLVASMIILMRAVNTHYRHVGREIDLDRAISPAEFTRPIMVLPIDRWSRVSEKALCFALSLSDEVHCVHVQLADQPDTFCDEWEEKIAKPLRDAGHYVPKLITLNSPFRYVLQPVVDYILNVERETTFQKICVLVPELVVRHWWENLLHNRRADLLKVILLVKGNRRIIVINIPWYLEPS